MSYFKRCSIERKFIVLFIFMFIGAVLLNCVTSSSLHALEKAYVTNESGAKVSVVDLSTKSVIKTIDIYTPTTSCSSQTPHINDIKVVGDKVFVSVPGAATTQCEINEIKVIDTSTDTVVNTIDTDRVPTGFKEHNGKLYVINQVSRTIHEIDPATETILQTIDFPVPPRDINNPTSLEIANGKIYLPFPGTGSIPGGVGVIELSSGLTETFIDFDTVDNYGPYGIKQVADNKIYLGGRFDVAVLDPTTDTISATTIHVKDETAGYVLNFAVASGKVYTANSESTVSVIDPASDTFITQIELAKHSSVSHSLVDIVASGDRVYVTDPSDGWGAPKGLHIIDTSTNAVVGSVSTTKYFAAIDIVSAYVPSSEEKAYVTNTSGTKVSVVDLSTNSVIKTIDIYTPTASCSSQTPHINDIKVVGDKVFVSVPGAATTQCEINEIKVIDTSTDTVVNTIDTDSVPTGFKEYNGKLYVINQGSNTIHEIDPATETILQTIDFPVPPRDINNPTSLEIANGKIYIPFPGTGSIPGGVGVIELSSGLTETFIDFDTVDNYGPYGIKQVADNKIYLGGRFDVAVLDPTTDTISATTIHVKDESAGYVLNFAVASGKVYTANSESTVSVIDPASDTFITQIELSVHPSTSHPLVDIVSSGDRVYVTDPMDTWGASKGIHIIDTSTDTVVGSVSTTEYSAAIDIFKIQQPGLLSEKAYVSNLMASNISVIDLKTNSVVNVIEIFNPSGPCASELPHVNDIKIIGSKVFVTLPGTANAQCEINQIIVIDAATETIVNSIETSSVPSGLKVYNGKLYALSRYGNVIHEIDPVTETIERNIPFSNPFPGLIDNPVYFEIVNGKIYLPFAGIGVWPGGTVQVLDLANGASIKFINFGSVDLVGPFGIKQVAQNKIYLGGRNNVAVVNTSTDTIVNVIQVKYFQTAGNILDFAVANNTVYTANGESTVSVINLSNDAYLGLLDIGAHPSDGHSLVDIVALGDMVYVTDPVDASGVPQGVKIIDSTTNTLVGNISTTEYFGAIDILIVQPPVPDADPLPDVVAHGEVTLTPPTAKDYYGITITATTNDPLTYSAIGTYTVEWIFEDDYGNIFTQMQTIIIEDNLPPELTCPNDINVDATGIMTEVTFEATAIDDFDPNVVIIYDPAPGSLFPIGTTSVTVTATDSSNNSSDCSFNVTVTDNIPPELTCPDDIAVSPEGTMTEVSYEATAIDNADPNVVIIYDPSPGSLFPMGTTIVTVTATDASNNSSECSFNVTVADIIAPELTCPDDIVVIYEGSMPEVFYEATAIDDMDPNVEIIYDPVPGSSFPIGVTIVTVTATDASNNSSECSFKVIVIEECKFRAFVQAKGQGEEHGLPDAINVSQVYIGMDANALTYSAAPTPPPFSTAYVTLSGNLSEDIRQIGSSREEWNFTVVIGSYADPNLDGYYPALSWDPNTFCNQSSTQKFSLYSVDNTGNLTLLVDDMLQTNQYQTKAEEAMCIPEAGCWLRYSIVWSQDMFVEMELPKGWSMISLPVIPGSLVLSDLFPEADVVYGFNKSLGYVRIEENEELEVGKGYWILLPEAKTYTLFGQTIEEFNLSVEDGWFMIGSCSSSSQASIDTGTIDVIYGFEQDIGYKRVLESEYLQPWNGYWILLNNIDNQANLHVESTVLLPREKTSELSLNESNEAGSDFSMKMIAQTIPSAPNASPIDPAKLNDVENKDKESEDFKESKFNVKVTNPKQVSYIWGYPGGYSEGFLRRDYPRDIFSGFYDRYPVFIEDYTGGFLSIPYSYFMNSFMGFGFPFSGNNFLSSDFGFSFESLFLSNNFGFPNLGMNFSNK